MKKSLIEANTPAMGYQGNVALYDQLFDTPINIARVLGHELAHELFHALPIKARVRYAEVAQWMTVKEQSGTKRLIPNRDFYVQPDGKEDVFEDFSNNIEYFLFDPKILKSKNPKIYNWILSTYGDKFILRKGH